MPIKVTCSNCGGVLHAPDDAGGKRGRCPTCGNILPIPPAEAPKASMGAMPEPGGRGGTRPPSFGEFALGAGPESIPIGSVAQAAGAGAAARASIPGLGDPPKAEPRKASAMPAAQEESYRPADPFARKGATTVGGGEGEGAVRRWAAAKSGLWWVGLGVFFYAIPALALPAWMIAEHFTKSSLLPGDEFPGLKLPYKTAVPLLVAVAPVLLGSFCMGLGRFGLGKAPRRSGVGGLGTLSGVASLLVFGAMAAVIMPAVIELSAQRNPPTQLFLPEELPGVYQRFAMFVAAAAILVGEFWFGSAVGRIGAALGDRRTCGRSTRYLLLLGLVVGGLVSLAAFEPSVFQFGSSAARVGTETSQIVSGYWEEYVRPQIGKLGEHQAVLKPGLFLLGGLLVVIIYCRLVGAARGAIREWLEVNR